MRSRSKVTIEVDGRKADGKSILQVLGLGVGYGREIVIRVDGEDEKETMEALVALVRNSWKEPA